MNAFRSCDILKFVRITVLLNPIFSNGRKVHLDQLFIPPQQKRPLTKIPLPESGVSAISLIFDNSLPKNQNVKISVDQTNPWRS